MKSILKKILLNTVAIAGVASFIPGLSYNHDLKTLLITALVLALINAFLKPFIKILFIPINIITLGLAGWLINVVILYLTTLVVSGFTIQPFTLVFYDTNIILSTFWAFVFVSFLLNIVTTIINWVLK